MNDWNINTSAIQEEMRNALLNGIVRNWYPLVIDKE